MTAPYGAIVKLYVDLAAQVVPTDVIETQSGRRYWVLEVRVQQKGKHKGRQHLACLVLDPSKNDEGTNRVHRIRWYKRTKKKR
jgi:hypothetical protein